MPMETGPLARNIVGHASGNEVYKEITQRCLKQLNVPYEAMYSTAGRTLARAIEANLLADWQTEFYTALLQNIKNGDYRMFNGIKWEPDTWPEAAQGVGLTEAPRGALAHYVGIKDKKVFNYQMVVPTTWTTFGFRGLSHRDSGHRSPTAARNHTHHTLIRPLYGMCRTSI